MHQRKDFSTNSPAKQANKAFRSAGGQPLPVRGLYKFAFTLNGKQIEHPCYVIPDLNEPLILGIDFIQHHQLWYCPKNKSFAWESQPNWGQGHLKICAATVVPPLSVAPKNLRSNCCSPSLSGLHQSFHSHRKWLTASGK